MNLDVLAEHFSSFHTFKSSPIYTILSEFVATQPEILKLVSVVPLQKSPRTVFFAAVHALLLSGVKHPLADYYPSLGGKKQISEANHELLCMEFLDFFKRYQAEIASYFLNNTQTNEAMRSLVLLPALSEIVRKEQQNKLSLIEIGTSAGFLLNIDKYRYQLNDFLLGDTGADTTFVTKWHGKFPENLQDNFIIIENKIGIDVNPLDMEDEEVRLWLKALIWPEHLNRLRSFDFACQVLKQNKKNITILKGRIENYIDKILTICKDSDILCFVCVWVLYQLNIEGKNKINEQLSWIAKSSQKKVYYILDDWEIAHKTEGNNIILREFDDKGDYVDQKICHTAHHGEQINCYL